LTPFDPEHARQRASDEDRDRVAALLGEGLATGRLTSVEHADRLAATYAAVTIGDLLPLTADLRDVSQPSSAHAGTERQTVTAAFSKIIKSGRWVAGRHTQFNSIFGALIVDLTHAVLPGREITLELNSTFGKLIVRVPKNARVIDEGGSAIFSKRNVSGGGGDDNDGSGPLIRVTGKARFGKVIVSRAGDVPHWMHWVQNLPGMAGLQDIPGMPGTRDLPHDH
jgi:hypothetical protein